MKQTIIFRGSVVFNKHPDNFLKESIEVLRNWFDGEVIVSTWKNQKEHVKNIKNIDKIILTDDPGPGPIQQLNRQIISYEAGLNEASNDLVMVTRTDFIHKKNIFHHLNDNPLQQNQFKIFKKKLLIGNMMSIDPSSQEVPNTFRLSDWFQVGLREDIENWGRIKNTISNMDLSNSGCTEKIWMTAVLKKNNYKNISPSDTSEIDKNFWDIVVNNFIIKNTKSTLHSYNMNWINQPEDLYCYISEELYNQKYNNILT
jgi:hypothetical protein